MSQRMNAINILGLSLLAVLGLMAVTAGAAQAVELELKKGEFTLEGSTFTAKSLGSEQVTGTGDEGTLLVAEVNLNLECGGADVVSGTVLLGGTAHASLLFLGCKVQGNSFCKVYPTKEAMEKEAEAVQGDLTATGLGLLLLMKKTDEPSEAYKHYLLLEPTPGSTTFTQVFLTSSKKGCTVELEPKVSGSTVVELPNALAAGGQLTQQLVTLSATELKALFPEDKLTYGGHPAFIDGGNVSAQLSGALHKDAKWGAE